MENGINVDSSVGWEGVNLFCDSWDCRFKTNRCNIHRDKFQCT